MSLICWCWEPLALEDMPEVTATVGADNLSPQHAQGSILVSCYSARDAVKIGGPSATRFELVICPVERRMAPSARIDSLFRIVFVKFSRTRWLSPLFS